MKNFKYVWAIGLIVTGLILIVPSLLFLTDSRTEANTSPWDHVPERNPAVSHAALITGPFETGSDVTRECLTCHEDVAHDVMQTTHWTWLAEPVEVEGRDEPVALGKANAINNFCIGIQSNWTGCTRCHAGYGWSDANFDFTNQENVDCLVCHDQSGVYVKAASGQVADGVDLVVAAQSVSTPDRENCGGCHFDGGGGNGVKHGDLDESLYFPTENLDVHMGKLDFICIDCHQTENHEIPGRLMSLSLENSNQIYCTDCHENEVHEDDRLNAHTDAVACQTCHVPAGARREPTKIAWDWSTAGQDLEEDPHEYLKIKGSFIYETNIVPNYSWYNGNQTIYLFGDIINPDVPTVLNAPQGNISDPNAKIWPFKIHYGNQIYDALYNYLLQPKTVGETGYWTTFDWNSALEQGSVAAGLEYSGQYGFAPTESYWPQTHMVAPAEDALQCVDCHGENGRLDWEALGYPGDPMIWGGRDAE